MATELDKNDEIKDAKVRGSTLGGIMQFFSEVRSEVAKVTWPTRNETTVTSIMVFIMIALAMVFFLVVDNVIYFAVRLLLGLGG